MSTRRRGWGAYEVAVAALFGVVLVVTVAWGMLLPAFDGPDEPWHHNSVARLVDGGGWPPAYEAMVLESTWNAVCESGAAVPGEAGRSTPTSPGERGPLLDGTSQGSAVPDFMLQHPPAHYGLVAVVVTAAGGGDVAWDRAQLVMRAVSAVLVASAVALVVGAVRWATGDRRAGLVGGASVLAIPFFTNAGAYVSNDTLLVAACSATLYLLLRAVREPGAAAWLLPAAGAAYGLALLTKGFALFLAPVVAVLTVLVVIGRRDDRRRSVLQAGAAAVLCLGIGGWWWIRNYLTLGTVQPSRLGARERSESPIDGYSLQDFAVGALDRLNATFWGRGGRPEVALPDVVPWTLSVVLGILVVVALTHRGARWLLVVLAFYPAAVAGTVILNAHGIYWDTGRPFQGVQGRYLYSGVAAFCLAVGSAFHVVSRRLPPRMDRAALPALLIILVAGSVAAQVWTLTRTWASRDPGSALLRGVAEGSPWTLWSVLAVAVVGASSAVLVTAAARVQVEHRAPHL
ncbi:DUF2142 domain-containing protein [Aeromicrobium halocynthiae]|uniref:DUF2142 domain-containing protein n=1 Tax=Aeromicrobium halocynthiae TaxID=560557 RepID=UPI0031D11CEA